jgi:hypothetical protein
METENNLYSAILRAKVGSFYLNDLAGDKLNDYIVNYPELRRLSDSLSSQLTAAK